MREEAQKLQRIHGISAPSGAGSAIKIHRVQFHPSYMGFWAQHCHCYVIRMRIRPRIHDLRSSPSSQMSRGEKDTHSLQTHRWHHISYPSPQNHTGKVVFQIPNSHPLSSLISATPNGSEVSEDYHELQGSSVIQALPKLSHDSFS